MATEKYWGVRIGRPDRFAPYIATNPLCRTVPILFVSRDAANLYAKELLENSGTTDRRNYAAVRVTVSY